MNAIKLWWRLVTGFSSPAVVPLDWRYQVMTGRESKHLIEQYKEKELPAYRLWEFNCTDFAWIFKGTASRQKLKPVGFVIGLYKGRTLHAWNVAVTQNEVSWIEPQSCTTWKGFRWSHIPLLVII
jgi:hypothetical protein